MNALDALRDRLAALVDHAPEIQIGEPEPTDPAYLELLAHLQGLVGQVFVFSVCEAGGNFLTLAMVSGVLGGAESFNDGSARFRILIGPHSVGTFTLSPKGFQFGGAEESQGELVVSWVARGLMFRLAGRAGTREV